jgi:uncharacterized Tic20 family protein
MTFISENTRLLKVLIHLTVFINLFAFAGLITAFIVWVQAKKENYEVEIEARKSINWQLTMMLLGIAVVTLSFISFGILGFILIPIYSVITILFPIIAALKNANGDNYNYPFAVLFIK